MAGNSSLSFFSSPLADANHDRLVNSADFVALASNFNASSNATFSEGDFNYDGKVNALDFNILGATLRRTLSASASVESAVSCLNRCRQNVQATAQSPTIVNQLSSQPGSS